MAEILNFLIIEGKIEFEPQKNIIKDKMAGRVYVVWRIFEKVSYIFLKALPSRIGRNIKINRYKKVVYCTTGEQKF